MASTRKGNAIGSPPDNSLTAGRRFTVEALAHVLTQELHLTPDVPLYVAYSGGMDSHVLLHALAQLRNSQSWRVSALHVDHGLQPNSGQWDAHCKSVCAELGIPYQSERVVVRDVAARGLEDAARQARYDALSRMLPSGAVLLTAHHQNDQAETVLLQLLRGGSVAGLAAMPAITDFARGRLARPLLGFERRALEAYSRTHGLKWIEDSSNENEALARNYVRHRMWPTILARWPQAAEQLALVARHQAQAAELMDALAVMDLGQVMDANCDISVASLAKLATARQANVLRYWLRSRGLSVPAERVLDQILARVAVCPKSQHAAIRWGNAQVQRYRDRLVASRFSPAAPTEWETAWNVETPLAIPGSDWVLHAESARGTGLARAHLDAAVLRVRFRRGGEQCRLRGHRHKVKKLLQEAGIPPWERSRLPLIYVGDELAAIGDRWVCDSYAAKPGEASLVFVLDRSRAP